MERRSRYPVLAARHLPGKTVEAELRRLCFQHGKPGRLGDGPQALQVVTGRGFLGGPSGGLARHRDLGRSAKIERDGHLRPLVRGYEFRQGALALILALAVVTLDGLFGGCLVQGVEQ
jgi:hypothetical protein